MSLRWRLIGGIALLLTALWAATAIWFFHDVRNELRDVLDARLASSARMVQGLIAGGDLQLPLPTADARNEPRDSSSRSLPTELNCQLWSLEGRLLTAARGAPEVAADQLPDGLSNQVVGGEVWRLYVLSDRSSGIRIITAERLALRASLVRDVAKAVSAPVLIVLPAMVLLVWLAVRRGLAPLERLRRSVQARGADALAPISTQSVPPEVAPLVSALNELFSRLQQVLERERRFTGDAAHELRTPLAGIKTHLQIAQSAEGSVRQRALQQAEAGLDRMSRLVNQLLMLARLDAQPVGSREPEECQPADVIDMVVQDLQHCARQRRITCLIRGELGGAAVRLPASLLHVALRNLLENAMNHTPEGGRVVLEAEPGAEYLLLHIMDEGPGLAPEELGRVSRRFYRAGNSGKPGSGLGLSIVETLAQRYDLLFSIENSTRTSGLGVSLGLPYAAINR